LDKFYKAKKKQKKGADKNALASSSAPFYAIIMLFLVRGVPRGQEPVSG